jgi:hypothetical protein
MSDAGHRGCPLSYSLIMNKFRKLGLIEYDHEKIIIRAELPADRVLND